MLRERRREAARARDVVEQHDGQRGVGSSHRAPDEPLPPPASARARRASRMRRVSRFWAGCEAAYVHYRYLHQTTQAPFRF